MKISHTAKNTYLQCPKKYWFYYGRKLKTKHLGSPLCFGSAVDEAQDVMLNGGGRGKWLEKFYSEWDKVRNSTVIYSNGDIELDLIGSDWDYREFCAFKKQNPFDPEVQRIGWESLREKGTILLDAYEDRALPLFKKVLFTQKFIQIHNESLDRLVGKADIGVEWYDGRRSVVDNKTTSVKYDQNSVKESEQLATYYKALRDEYKLDSAAYVTVSKKLRKQKLPKCQIDVIIDNIPETFIINTMELYDDVMEKIKDGEFPRNWDGCQTKFGPCEYWNLCHNDDDHGLEEQ